MGIHRVNFAKRGQVPLAEGSNSGRNQPSGDAAFAPPANVGAPSMGDWFGAAFSLSTGSLGASNEISAVAPELLPRAPMRPGVILRP